jgi:MFS family permease
MSFLAPPGHHRLEPGAIEVITDQATATEDRRRWLALYVLCLGMLMIVLDATIVNVALPSIQEDLGFEQTDLAWVVNAYLIAFGGLLLLAGRLGDLVGQVLPADVVPGGGCVETGTGVVIANGCGGCAGSMP